MMWSTNSCMNAVSPTSTRFHVMLRPSDSSIRTKPTLMETDSANMASAIKMAAASRPHFSPAESSSSSSSSSSSFFGLCCDESS